MTEFTFCQIQFDLGSMELSFALSRKRVSQNQEIEFKSFRPLIGVISLLNNNLEETENSLTGQY